MPHDRIRYSSFLLQKMTSKFERDHPLRGRQAQVGWVKISRFDEKLAVTQRHIVSIKIE